MDLLGVPRPAHGLVCPQPKLKSFVVCLVLGGRLEEGVLAGPLCVRLGTWPIAQVISSLSREVIVLFSSNRKRNRDSGGQARSCGQQEDEGESRSVLSAPKILLTLLPG